MICDRVRVLNFRNIEEADVRFTEGVNVLWGNNAQGKTNLLEAIRFAGIGKSFRAIREAEMIRFGCEVAFVSLDYHDSKRMQNLSVRVFGDARHRQVTHNGVRISKLSEAVGAFETVLFSPEHLGMIKEGPALRREFLDTALCSIYPVYLSSLQRYNRILKERNRLIREAGDSPEKRKIFDETADAWSSSLAREAAVISSHRQAYLRELCGYVRDCFEDMTYGTEAPELIYVGSSGDEAEFYGDEKQTEQKYYRLLTERHERELAAKTTLYGPHRDDVEVRLNGKSARLFASQGQQRSLALAIKLSEGEILEHVAGEKPVYLLDDVLSELDGARKEYLLRRIGGQQVIITSCDPAAVKGASVTRVENGCYYPSRKG